MFIYTVPIAMHPRRGDTSRSAHIPQNAKRSDTEIIRRLSSDRFVVMRKRRITPKRLPRRNTPIFTAIGIITLVISIEFPVDNATANDMATLYSTRPTASSSATTCSSVFTKSPRAPVCLIVIIVEAGAVADASAASTMENARFIPRIKYVTTNTAREAMNASKIVSTTIFIPFFLRVEKRKNSPVLNAMNARAISERKSILSMTVTGIRSMQYGPIRIPVSMYAVTFGRWKRFVILVIAKPRKSISAIEMITDAI